MEIALLPRMLGGLLALISLAVAAYALLCVALYFMQSSLIFYPRPNDAQLRRDNEGRRVEIRSAGATVEGWWVENPAATSEAVLLYFGGNAEDVLYMAGTISKLNVRRLLVVNYRGYGRSTGKPGQDALYEDGRAVYEHVLERGVRPEQIVVMGRSLGSGVATMLAGTHPVRATILITPFESLNSVAASHYPYFPVRFLLRHPFPSMQWAVQAHAPALILAAQRDFVIPPAHARCLAKAWGGEVELHVLTEVGHNDIEMHPDYYRSINAFVTGQNID